MAVISDQYYAMPFPDGEVWVYSGWQDSSEGRNERCQQQLMGSAGVAGITEVTYSPQPV